VCSRGFGEKEISRLISRLGFWEGGVLRQSRGRAVGRGRFIDIVDFELLSRITMFLPSSLKVNIFGFHFHVFQAAITIDIFLSSIHRMPRNPPVS
jgi:hypothetical protein